MSIRRYFVGGDVSLGGSGKITGSALPTDATDLTSKEYVDDLASSKIFWFWNVPSASLINNVFLQANGASANEEETRLMSYSARTIKNFSVRLLAQPGVGNTRTFTVRRNILNTVMTLTFTGPELIKTYTGSIDLAILDTISISHTTTGAPTASICFCTLEYA